jgi:hypothetical protein
LSKQEFHVGFKTGTFTGDGNETQAITGVGFQPKRVEVVKHLDGDGDSWVFVKTDRHAADRCTTHYSSYHLNRANRIKSLDADGFTVGNDNINVSAQVYDYCAWG